MKTSEAINEIASALAKAQGAMDKAAKDSTNPHFKSKYADLSSVMDACRKALTENQIAVVQAPGSDDSGAVVMTTRLIHSSGQWMENTIACRPMKQDAQGMGSVTISYLRRYSLAAMTGVVADDDDGNAAAMSPQAPPQQRQQPKPPAKASTATNSTKAADEAPRAPDELSDPIPFNDDGGQVSYIDTKGGKHPMDLDKYVSRLEQIAQARDTFSDEDFAAAMWRNAECQERAAAAWRALWASRNMKADEWRPR